MRLSLTIFAALSLATALVALPACDNPIACQDNDDCPTDQVCASNNICAAPSGEPEGTPEGNPEGTPEGNPEGTPEGNPEGTPEGNPEGTPEGNPEGTPEGNPEGTPEGNPEGTPEGNPEPTPEPGPEACPSPPCFILVDSATPKCEDEQGYSLDPCPAPGEEGAQDGSVVDPAPDLVFSGPNILDQHNNLTWELGQVEDMNHAEAEAHCAALTSQGLTWRLPTIRELFTLLDFGASPTMTAGFSPPVNGLYHTSSSQRVNTWYGVELASALSGPFTFEEDDDGAVKCVSGEDRGGADFIRVGAPADNIAMDIQTGITLQTVPNDSEYWWEALEFCEALVLNEKEDWHLATAKELVLMLAPASVDTSRVLHPFFTVSPQTSWSSSVVGFSVYWIDHSNGFYGQSDPASGRHPFRCARGL